MSRFTLTLWQSWNGHFTTSGLVVPPFLSFLANICRPIRFASGISGSRGVFSFVNGGLLLLLLLLSRWQSCFLWRRSCCHEHEFHIFFDFSSSEESSSLDPGLRFFGGELEQLTGALVDRSMASSTLPNGWVAHRCLREFPSTWRPQLRWLDDRLKSQL